MALNMSLPMLLSLTCVAAAAGGGTRHGGAGLPILAVATVLHLTTLMRAPRKYPRASSSPPSAATVWAPIMHSLASAPASPVSLGPQVGSPL